MSKWDERSIANLLPLSVSQDFTTALKEWSCSGEMRMQDEMNCELCGKKDLHYQFEIVNQHLGNSLWVGSSCIQKFDIYVKDEKGLEVTSRKAAYLNKQFKIKYISEALTKLLETKPSGIIDVYPKASLDATCVNQFLSRQKLNPKQVSYIFMRLDQESIPCEKKYFSIADTNDNYYMLVNLKEAQFRRIELALTKSQKDDWELRNKRK